MEKEAKQVKNHKEPAINRGGNTSEQSFMQGYMKDRK